MVTAQRVLTADDVLQLPDDGQRHELIAGELRTMAPSSGEHGAITAVSTISLGQHVRVHQLGRVFSSETGFLLARDPDTVRAPDIAFVRRERVAAVEAAGPLRGYWPGAPDLAIEVVSPNDLYTEVEAKVATWLAYGTRMVIVLNPRQRTAAVHRSATQVRHLTADDTLDGEDVVPGWAEPVRALFAI